MYVCVCVCVCVCVRGEFNKTYKKSEKKIKIWVKDKIYLEFWLSNVNFT